MKGTGWRLLVAIVSLAAVFGWALMRLVDAGLGRYLPMPATAPIAIWMLALALLAWTLHVRPRIARNAGVEPLDPLVAGRTSALAMASSRTGAAVCGLYLGFLIGFAAELANPAGQRGAIVAAICVVGALGVLLVGVWLERICRIDDDGDQPQTAAEGAGE